MPDVSKKRAFKFRQRRKLGLTFWLPMAWIVFIVICAISAGLWTLPEPDHMDWINQAALPGAKGKLIISGDMGKKLEMPHVYLLGTDTMGRDIVTRLMFGARVSLAIGLISSFIGLVLGGTLGMLAGFYRGRFEALVTAAMDTILAFPAIVLLLAITFYLGACLNSLIIALSILTIPVFFRVARANTLTFAEREFVRAARALGESDAGILIREILPNILMPMTVYALLIVAILIMAEGVLSFLGLGVPSPTPSWGGMIAEGKEMLDETPHISIIPAFVMFLTILSFNLMGDTLRSFSNGKEDML